MFLLTIWVFLTANSVNKTIKDNKNSGVSTICIRDYPVLKTLSLIWLELYYITNLPLILHIVLYYPTNIINFTNNLINCYEIPTRVFEKYMFILFIGLCKIPGIKNISLNFMQ